MMLPCSQFRDASWQQRKEDVQVFLVGDYFSPMEFSAALQRQPDPKAERKENNTSDAKTFL